ncbi:hypothetical protein CLTHE_17640 [Clostridium thermobutyricum DSM 4928]|uniref:Uncharacterized protein n=1 Tax=Clostridium thermobutyricum DSM 4928 TaxID=1121339 RepID=A0A1V4SUL0_9CLOT|nr:hypothetical protein CLTHE_17640 [Clostridium thermobutyricum DSM 4928]
MEESMRKIKKEIDGIYYIYKKMKSFMKNHITKDKKYIYFKNQEEIK